MKNFDFFDFFSGEGKNFLNDEECAAVPRNIHTVTIICGASYLFFDTFNLYYLIANR